VMCMMYL